MNYRVKISRTAEKHMRHIDEATRRRIRTRINALRGDPYNGASKLASMPGFRQRVGDYRIVYEIDTREQLVHVTGIFHRREAYR